MPLVTMQLGGMDRLAARVTALQNGARVGLKAGVTAASGIFEAEAKLIVPVLSGNLQMHIHTETVTDNPDVQVAAVTPTVESGNKYGFDPAYARRIEEGFIGVDSLGRHYHQAAQPYMRPAYDTKHDEADAAIRSNIVGELQKVGG